MHLDIYGGRYFSLLSKCLRQCFELPADSLTCYVYACDTSRSPGAWSSMFMFAGKNNRVDCAGRYCYVPSRNGGVF